LPCPGDDERMSFSAVVMRASQTGDKVEGLKQSRMRSQAMLLRVSAVVAQRLAYKEMPAWIYYGVTTVFYCVIVTIACFAPSDIGILLDIVGAYAISCAAFFIPSVFYTKALQKFKLKDADAPEVKTDLLICKLFIGFGCINSFLGLFSVAISLAGLE